MPDCKSPKLFIDIMNTNPNGLEEFVNLPIVQEKIVAMEKNMAEVKSRMVENIHES